MYVFVFMGNPSIARYEGCAIEKPSDSVSLELSLKQS
jgi:hypothetical protein